MNKHIPKGLLAQLRDPNLVKHPSISGLLNNAADVIEALAVKIQQLELPAHPAAKANLALTSLQDYLWNESALDVTCEEKIKVVHGRGKASYYLHAFQVTTEDKKVTTNPGLQPVMNKLLKLSNEMGWELQTELREGRHWVFFIIPKAEQ